MSKYQRHLTSALAAVAVVAILAGCAASPSAGSPEPKPEPTGDATPIAEEPIVVTLSVGGDGIVTLDDEGAVLATLDYTADGAAAVDFLSEAFGSDPVISPRAGDASCVADATRAVWGDDAFELVYDYPERSGLPDGQSVAVDAKAATVGNVAVQTPEGVAVGDQVNELIAALPNVGTHNRLGTESLFSVDFAVVSGTYEDISDTDFGMTDNVYWGAQAIVDNDVIAELRAPTYFQSAC